MRTTRYVHDSRKVRELLATFAAQMAERDRERGRQIQALRKKAGHRSAEDAAQVADVSHRTFQNWEGGAAPLEENLPGLAKALKLTRAEVRALFPEPPIEVPDLAAVIGSDRLPQQAQLDRIEEKLDEILRRLTAPDEASDAPPKVPQPKQRPPLPSPRGKPAPRKRQAGSG